MTNKSEPCFKCQYCQREFRRESTLTRHLCENKRRWQQERETGVQLGFRAYLRFYELSQGSAQFKTYQDFVSSSFYLAFVRFGRRLVEIRAVNPAQFIDWLLKKNIKLDAWCQDSVYEEFLSNYIRREATQDALERALMEMQKYADETDGLAGFQDYFRYGNNNRICHHIVNGRISPWVLFNCQSGVEFLERLNPEQINMIMPWIDPDFWQRKFKDYLSDSEWIRAILSEAGL